MPQPTKNTFAIHILDILNYEEAWLLQQELHEKRVNDTIPDTLLLLEHHPVITLGTRGTKKDLLLDEESIQNRGVTIHRSTRGGQATLHAPGQLVGYFICKLRGSERKIRELVSGIESSLIATVKHYAIASSTREDHPGVWTAQGKLASIGIAIKQASTMHGFALNCSLDLSLFSLLSPCGLPSGTMCSMETILGSDKTPDMQRLKQDYIEYGLSSFAYDHIVIYNTNTTLGDAKTYH